MYDDKKTYGLNIEDLVDIYARNILQSTSAKFLKVLRETVSRIGQNAGMLVWFIAGCRLQ